MHWQPLWGPSYQNVTNFGPKVRQRAIDEIDKVLALPYIDEFNQGMNRTFLETMRGKLTVDPAQSCNQEFLAWADTYQQQYATDVQPFEILWPELYELINNDL